MQFLSAVTVAALAVSANAITCKNVTVPVTISARTGVFNLAVPQSNLDVTTLVLNITQQGRNFTNTVLTGYNTTQGTYNISGTFCMPSNMSTTSNPTLQILTHGIGFDKGYWNIPYNGYNYSYVNTATSAGYCTFAYDRLGIGNSTHATTSARTLNEIQSFLEVAALAQITRMFRNSSVPTINSTFSKIVHVGHSFGSAQTYALVNQYPNISDGIILTGFSMNASFVGFFAAGGNYQLANLNQPLRFSNVNGTQIQALANIYAAPLLDYIAPIDFTTLPKPQTYVNGYIIASDSAANEYQFLYPGHFDPLLLENYIETKAKQPVTAGELLTLGSIPMMNAFAGPTMVITGQYDLPYCGGDCLATGNSSLSSIPAKVSMNFPNVATSNFTVYIQPNTGHGLNAHYNATAGYQVIQSFLKSKSL